MTKSERLKVREALSLLMRDDPRWEDAISILCKLAGYEDKYKWLRDPNIKTISMLELAAMEDKEFMGSENSKGKTE